MSATQDCPERTCPNEKVDSSDTLITRHRRDYTAPLATEASTLRYRSRALWLLGLYVPLLVIPWVLTCILVYHPIDRATYYDQSGLHKDSLKLHQRMMNALSVVFSVTGLVTVPIISAILSEAAVVYAQKRRETQSVNIRQLFALADRGWSSLAILRDALPTWTSHSNRRADVSSRFLWLAALFLLICGIQQPLREALVSKQSTRVMTSNDNFASGFRVTYNFKDQSKILGFDAEPYDIARIPEDIVTQDLMNSLATFNGYEYPPHLWQDPSGLRPYYLDTTSTSLKRQGPWTARQPWNDYFVAALPNATMTGVLRQRVMRLNSTVVCLNIARSDFPSSCAGEDPFVVSISRARQTEIRLCVPGRRGAFPWQLTRNMQNITEDVYMDLSGANSTNLIRRCTVHTVRGYFELGNYRNGETHGPLLERWEEPDRFAAQSEYNDWLSPKWQQTDRWRRPSAEDKITDLPGWPKSLAYQTPWSPVPASNNPNRTMSGPLMTSMIAMFGERSLLATANSSTNATDAASQICTSGRMPFSIFDGYDKYEKQCANLTGSNDQDDEVLASILSKFMVTTFNNTQHISASVYFANQAMLLQTVQNTQDFTARQIRSAPGGYIQRPVVTMYGLVIISALMFIQLTGLAYLVWYIYQVPTWTALLDAMAIARIANSLDKGTIPAIGSVTKQELDQLGEMNGLIGVVDSVHMDEETDDSSLKREIELGLGAP
ncbi:hypothetical protein CC86DRAFT_361976, partial [Ophiobolus disseminans]